MSHLKKISLIFILFTIALPFSSIKTIDGDYRFISQWGSSGSGDGQFNSPYGIAVDDVGNVFVSDWQNYRIQKFTSDGIFSTKWGSYGSGDGQFGLLDGVAVDDAGNVYVADTDNDRIQKFSSNGAFVTKWGNQGSGDGQFFKPECLAVDNSGNIYVSDTNNNRIQKFTSHGTFATKWGSQGSGNGQFNIPVGITVDSIGNVYVAEWNNNRIQKFTSDGIYITQWGGQGTENGQFNNPFGITVDSIDNIYVVDKNNNRIQKFTSGGTYITQWGNQGSGDGQFNSPYGIAVDDSGIVYISDFGNSRIQKFNSSINGIKVIVNDSNGVPISGASVLSTSQPIGQTPLNGIASIDGIVIFSDVKLGSYSIAVSKNGYLSVTSSTDLIAGNSAELIIVLNTTQMIPTTADFKVTVMDKNNIPISGASIISTVQPTGQKALNGISNAEGITRFNDILPGTYTIQTSKTGYMTAISSINVKIGTVNEVTLTLQTTSWQLFNQMPELGPTTTDRVGFKEGVTPEFEFTPDVKAWKLELEWTGVSQLHFKGTGGFSIIVEKVLSDGSTVWLDQFNDENNECDRPGIKSIIFYDVSEVYFIHAGVSNQLLKLRVYTTNTIEQTSVKIVLKDASANPLSNVSVVSASQPTGQFTLSGVTAGDGSIIFSDINPGAYTFMTSKKGYLSKNDSLTASIGVTAEKTIILEVKPQPSGGIPGFPTEGIILGVLLILIYFLLHRGPSAKIPKSGARSLLL